MLNLLNDRKENWPDSLRPIGEGELEKEPFEDWWVRHGAELKNLHPQIAEQWVYRHWTWAHFKFLELRRITWSVQRFSTIDFLNNVHLEFGGPADSEYDYRVFMGDGAIGGKKTLTAENWQDGTWTIPPVVLATPQGIIGHEGRSPSVKMVLVEGSLRYRWLNALHERGVETGPHDIYVLDDVGGCPPIA